MKEYDLIAIGTGSAMNIVQAVLDMTPDARIAIVDKDPPGGICLNKGCIPSKVLVYPAEIIRMLDEAKQVGLNFRVKKPDFAKIMKRMRTIVNTDVKSIRTSLTRNKNIDFYPAAAQFTGPYQLQVGQETIASKIILLCTGSKPRVPTIRGLEIVGYHTSDTILNLKKLPASIAIFGGGYIAAEYGHFFSAMGSKVTIIGRNRQFLPMEEPEVSELARKKMSRNMTILTNQEILSVETIIRTGKKRVIIRDKQLAKPKKILVEDVLLAIGRSPNTDILHPEKSGVETDIDGWIRVNDFLETTQPGIWAFGDAVGAHQFKHVANYESRVVFYNAILEEKTRVDYHAVPHAVFTYPEIASVGLKEKEASEAYGEDNILIGFQKYEDTARGNAMGVKDYFVKVILERDTERILGAHIIGPQASVLIQEIINLMYTERRTSAPIEAGMHIHPSLSEVVGKAFSSLMSPEHYRKTHKPKSA